LQGEGNLLHATVFKKGDEVEVTRICLDVAKQRFVVKDYLLTDRTCTNLLGIDDAKRRGKFLSGQFALEDSWDARFVRAERVGPIKDWSLVESRDGVNICVSTEVADYYLETPSEAYSELHYQLYDRASVAVELWKLCRAYPSASLERLCNELSVVDGREFVVQNLHFVHHHVTNWADADRKRLNGCEVLALNELKSMGRSFPEVTGSSKSYYPRTQAKTTPFAESLFRDVFSEKYLGCPDVVV
jgi:hypothetical protein